MRSKGKSRYEVGKSKAQRSKYAHSTPSSRQIGIKLKDVRPSRAKIRAIGA